VRTLDDLIDHFRSVLPQLRKIHAALKPVDRSAPEITGF
jgi:hypothetical protein